MEQLSPSEQIVLVIDDNPANLKVAVEQLRPTGAQILTARDGTGGIERARLTRPDLILLDVQMPGTDGFETCRQLKADHITAAIPVIFMTALSDIEDIVSGFAAGGVDYITKPFRAEELLARARTHLMLYGLQRALRSEISERRQAELALRKANQELQRLSVLDSLTEVANRRRFDEYLGLQLGMVGRPALSLLLCDVDYFKRYNDTFGHPAGDRCLQMVARQLSGALRHKNDLVARYGGEEFGVILPDTDLDGAHHVAETIRQALRGAAIPHAAGVGNGLVSLSIGIACAPCGTAMTPAALVAAADAALYAAKQQGRDRVVVAQPTVTYKGTERVDASEC
jgi:diguanylate cyclase (GGDEF)-like protein